MRARYLIKRKRARFRVFTDEPGIVGFDDPDLAHDAFITVEEFAALAGISRRTIDRYRKGRTSGFPPEYDVGRGRIPRPRFKLIDVRRWLDSRALW